MIHHVRMIGLSVLEALVMQHQPNDATCKQLLKATSCRRWLEQSKCNEELHLQR
jgi:hypothetical protein